MNSWALNAASVAPRVILQGWPNRTEDKFLFNEFGKQYKTGSTGPAKQRFAEIKAGSTLPAKARWKCP
jgi:hypothetical protein